MEGLTGYEMKGLLQGTGKVRQVSFRARLPLLMDVETHGKNIKRTFFVTNLLRDFMTLFGCITIQNLLDIEA